MTNRHPSPWPVAALISAFSLWGASFLFGKLALAALPVSQVVLYRFTLASLVLLPVAWRHRTSPRRADLPLFVLTGFLTVPVTFLVQFDGLALTSVSSAALIIGILPPLLAVAAALVSHERLNGQDWTGIGLSVLGMVLLVGPHGPRRGWVGDGLVLLSLLAVVAWTLLGKRLLRSYPALDATAYILACGTLTLIPLSLLLDGAPRVAVPTLVGLAVVALGLLCTALPFALYNWGCSGYPPPAPARTRTSSR